MQESTKGATIGVRDRKRAETFRRIHEAAVELTLRDGLATATVTDIAERAGISRRTFFNYFPCKEDAVLGLSEPQIPAHAIEAFLHPALPPPDGETPGKERFRQALELTVTTMASLGSSASPKVHAIAAANSELFDRVREHRNATQELLVNVLTERISEENRSESTTDSARALLLLAGAVLRFAHADNPDILENPDPAAIKKAISTFIEALKDIP